MSTPGISASVQVAFQNNPFDTSFTWTDITKYVKQFTVTMGRQHELQQVNPSTANIQLSNQNGIFSPWNTSSPYYYSGTGLTVGRPVRILAGYSGSVYPIYWGVSKGWVPAYANTKSDMLLESYDLLALLNLNTLDTMTYNVYPETYASHFWTCADAVGSNTAADSAGSVALVPSTSNAASLSFTFGVDGPSIVNNNTAASIASGVLAAASIPVAASAVTFECWMQAGDDQISQIMSCTSGEGLFVFEQYPLFYLGSTAAIGGTNVIDGNWHHIAAVQVKGQGASVFVDGAYSGGTAASATASVNTYFTGIGQVSGSVSPTFNGAVANVAIYSLAMPASVIASQYTIGKAAQITQDSGSRVAAILSVAGVPTSRTNVQTGNITVQPSSSNLATTTAMSYLNTVVATERGFLYQNTSGSIVYTNRHYPYENVTSASPQATFGYASGQLHYTSAGLTPTLDDIDLWNNIPVQRTGGVLQTAANASSQSSYGRRTLSGYTNLLFVSDVDALSLAGGLLYQYQQPAPRVRAITMDSTMGNGANIPQMFGRNLLDRITINWRPLDGTSSNFSQQSFIEQVTHTYIPQKWTTTFAVTPIGTESFFILGTSQLGTGVLGI